MADDKGKDKGKDKDKGEKKEGGGAAEGERRLYQYSAELVGVLFLGLILARFSPQIIGVLNNRGYGTGSESLDRLLNSLYYAFIAFALYFTIFSNILSVLFIMGIIYALIRLTEITKAQDAALEAAHGYVEAVENAENKQWVRVTEHINTDNPSDWRLAILEADIMLDDLLNKIGTTGSTIGEKLQQVEKGDFATLDKAWDAHKVRNNIAHEGSEFLLNKREAQRVIRLYEEVFTEFHFI